MPRKTAHFLFTLIFSFFVGSIIYGKLFSIILFTLLSVLTTSFPDKIERPYNMFHRKFYHSITFFTVLLIFQLMSIQTPFSGIIFGYLSHLILDYSFGKYKPLI